MQMVSVPSGDFQMGCDPDHNGGHPCDIHELPLHTIYLDAFWIDRFEVTNAQYKQYRHELRASAQVCREGLVFTGTVGAENCSKSEIAAMFAVLHTDYLRHAFKLGLGKALGLGTVRSEIRNIWIRDTKSYEWKAMPCGTDAQTAIQGLIPGIEDEFQILMKVQNRLNRLEADWNETKLKYPEAGLMYWKEYWQKGDAKLKQDKGVGQARGSRFHGGK